MGAVLLLLEEEEEEVLGITLMGGAHRRQHRLRVAIGEAAHLRLTRWRPLVLGPAAVLVAVMVAVVAGPMHHFSTGAAQAPAAPRLPLNSSNNTTAKSISSTTLAFAAGPLAPM